MSATGRRQPMDRRSFLKATSLAAVGTAAATIPIPKGEAQTANIILIQNASHLHQLLIADTFAGIYQPSLWSNAAQATLATANNIRAGGWDATIRAAAARVSASNLHQSLMNKTKMVNAIKVYQPSFTLTVLDRYLNQVPQAPDQITTAWNKIRTQGVSTLMLNHATGLGQMATFLGSTGFRKPTPPHTPPVRAGSPLPLVQLPGGRGSLSGGGGGYTCKTDGSVQFFVGTGLAVLAFMSAPISGPVLGAGLVLGAFLEMAGYGMALWGVGHELAC